MTVPHSETDDSSPELTVPSDKILSPMLQMKKLRHAPAKRQVIQVIMQIGADLIILLWPKAQDKQLRSLNGQVSGAADLVTQGPVQTPPATHQTGEVRVRATPATWPQS